MSVTVTIRSSTGTSWSGLQLKEKALLMDKARLGGQPING